MYTVKFNESKESRQAIKCIYHPEAKVEFVGSNQEIDAIEIKPFRDGCEFTLTYKGDYTIHTEERVVFLDWKNIPNFLARKINQVK